VNKNKLGNRCIVIGSGRIQGGIKKVIDSKKEFQAGWKVDKKLS